MASNAMRLCLLTLLAAVAVTVVSGQSCSGSTPNPCFSADGSKSICCAGGCGPVTSTGGATCQGAAPTLSVLTLVDLSNGALGPQPNTGSKFGDITYFRAPLTDLSGNAIGRANGLCFYAAPNPDFEQQCTVSFYFDGTNDAINVQGPFRSTATQLGVNSGTGKYAGAGGYIVSTFVSSQANILTFRYDIYLF